MFIPTERELIPTITRAIIVTDHAEI